MLPLAAGSLILGAIQTGVGMYQLNKLNKEPMPNFGITPEQMQSFSRAQGRTGYGYSPEQRSNYFQQVAGRYAQNYGNAMKLSGGNLSGALNRGLQAGNLRDFSNFAAGDAQQQQANIRIADQRGDIISGQRNMITNQNIQNRIRKEQAFGGAMQSGLQNLAGAANFFAMNDGFAQLKGAFGGNKGVSTNVIGQSAGPGGGIGPDGAYNANLPAGGSAPAGGWQAQNQMGMNGYAVQPNSGGTLGYGTPQFGGASPYGGVPYSGGFQSMFPNGLTPGTSDPYYTPEPSYQTLPYRPNPYRR